MAAFASAPRHRAQRRAPLRTMAVITSTVAGATLLTLGATGATLAKWTVSAPVSGGSVTAGSLTLLIDTQAGIELSDFENMLPGDRMVQQIELTTLGTVAADVTVAREAGLGAHEIRVAAGPCAGPLGGLALGTAGLGVWLSGQTKTVCVEVTLPPSAPSSAQGATTDFELTFLATQRVN